MESSIVVTIPEVLSDDPMQIADICNAATNFYVDGNSRGDTCCHCSCGCGS